MRTTLDIADDVLLAAKELARRQGKTAGEVLSELARQGLTRAASRGRGSTRTERFLGFEPFPATGQVVTNDVVNQLRNQDDGE